MSKEQYAVLLLGLSIGLALAVDICEHQMNGARLSHPADCNQFVECRNGKTDRISSCPLGLHFNRFKGLCDLRQRAACDIEFVNFVNEETNCSACCSLYGCYVNPECPETPGTPTTVTTPTTPITTSTPETNTTTETTPTSPSTPETHTTTENTEIPGTLSTATTPKTTTIPATPSTTATPDISTTSSPKTTKSPVTPETPVTPDIPKINQCANNLTVCQHETDKNVMHVNGTCNQYIVCVAGCAYIMSCPANLQYNIATQECDYPQNVDCPWQSTTSITGPSGVSCAHHGQCEKQNDGKLFANPNSDGYIICQCECEIERPCAKGTKFDAKLSTCVRKENKTESENENRNGNGNGEKYEIGNKTGNKNDDKNTTEAVTAAGGGKSTISTVCRNNVEICKNQTEGKLFPMNGICNKFYKCNFGCAVEILCPNNLVYNPQAQYCDYPSNYKCPWPHTAPSGPSAGPSGIACASGGRCEGEMDGTLFPSLTSCAKFVVCQCECEVERDCSKNLYWDKQLLTCNYSGNVTCEINL